MNTFFKTKPLAWLPLLGITAFLCKSISLTTSSEQITILPISLMFIAAYLVIAAILPRSKGCLNSRISNSFI